jgi:hypothetical protein
MNGASLGLETVVSALWSTGEQHLCKNTQSHTVMLYPISQLAYTPMINAKVTCCPELMFFFAHAHP